MQSNAPSSIFDDTEKRSTSSDYLKKVVEKVTSLEPKGLDNVEDYNSFVHQDDSMALRGKSRGGLAGEKQSRAAKQLGMPAFEMVFNDKMCTVDLESAVL